MGDDPLGRRKGKTLAGVTTRYLYDGANPIQEKQNGAVSANLLAGPNLDEWYARTAAGQTHSYLPDALGSTLKLTDSSQAIVAGYTYEPYGKASVSGSPGTNSLTYTGREDDGTGLYYYRARYYHPGIGRFVSEDPIGLWGGANLMAYVGGNPISRTDPTGLLLPAIWPAAVALCELCPACCVAIAVAAGANIANICLASRPSNHEDPEETLGSISKAQAALSKGRPSVQPPNDPNDDDEDDWEGCKKRPKQCKINSIGKSIQNWKNSVK